MPEIGADKVFGLCRKFFVEKPRLPQRAPHGPRSARPGLCRSISLASHRHVGGFRPSKHFRSDEQGAHRGGRGHAQHCIIGGALEPADGVGMQRARIPSTRSN